jgi:hypothetical protein
MKPFQNISFPGDSRHPWVQDPRDKRFFFISLTRAWNPQKDTYYEKNPQTGEFQALVFDPDFLNKRLKGNVIPEDSIGISSDGLTLWRFSLDSTATLEIEKMAFDTAEESGYITSSGQLYTDKEGRVLSPA